MIFSSSFRGALAPLWLAPVLWLAPAETCRLRAGEPPGAAAYDPATREPDAAIEVLELEVFDAPRRRHIPVRLLLPAASAASPSPAAVVLFSHGLGGSRRTSEFLGQHWAARGYAAVFPQHAGSDEAVWKQTPLAERSAALARAATPENARARVLDVRAVLDHLERWTGTAGHPLAARLDLSAIGMSGHSFGALTTQTLCGQTAPPHSHSPHSHSLATPLQCDHRIAAALAMSPSAAPGDQQTALQSVRIPWMMMTGSDDHAPIGRMSPEARRTIFNHLPKRIDRYELMLGGAHHFAFTEDRLPARIPARNARHHQTIEQISTAFWDAYLRHQPAAKHWLQGMAIRATLQPRDRWRVGIAGR